MGIPNLYKYYLLNASGAYYTVQNGVVQTTAVKTELPSSPDGWDGIKHDFLRNEKYHGVFRKMTSPIKFPQGSHGAVILKSLVEIPTGYDFEAYCKLIIEKRADILNGWEYRIDFEAELDFSTLQDGTKKSTFDTLNTTEPNEEPYITISAVEKGLPELIEANESKEYRIPLDTVTGTINVDGIERRHRATWYVGAGEDPGQNLDNHVPEMQYFTSDEEAALNLQNQQRKKWGNVVTEIYNQQRYFYKASVAHTANLSGRLLLNMDLNGVTLAGLSGQTFKVSISRLRSGTPTLFDLYSEADPNIYATNAIDINYNVNIPVIANDELYFLVFFTPGNANTQLIEVVYGKGSMNLDFQMRIPPTQATGYRYLEFAKRIIAKVTNNTGTLISNYLSIATPSTDQLRYRFYDDIPYNTFVCSGNAVKSIPNSPITSSLADMYQDCFSRWALGLGVSGNNVIMEELSYFYNRNSEITVLGQVIGLRKTPAMEYVYNEIHAGYSNTDYDVLNGIYAYNTSRKYSLPILRKAETLNLISPYNAEPQGIEKLRAAYFTSKRNKDDKEDDEVILFEVAGTPVGGLYELRRYGSAVSNVLNSSTAYNIGKTPARFVHRHFNWIASICNNSDTTTAGKVVTFLSGEKNTTVSTLINGVQIREGSDLYPALEPVNLRRPKLFLPVYYEFEYKPDYNLLSLIQNNPYGYIEFYDNNIMYRGFILDVNIYSAQVDTYKFKLLGCPINNGN